MISLKELLFEKSGNENLQELIEGDFSVDNLIQKLQN